MWIVYVDDLEVMVLVVYKDWSFLVLFFMGGGMVVGKSIVFKDIFKE